MEAVVLLLLLPLLLPAAVLLVVRWSPIKSRLATISSAIARARKPIIFVTDVATAHHLLVRGGGAAAGCGGGSFSNRPPSMTPSAVLSGRRYHNITSAPYGPLWRALRQNLTSGVLHPAHLHGYAAARRRALRRLVTDLTEQQRLADGGVVLAAESIRDAMFGLAATMCFGLGDGDGGGIDDADAGGGEVVRAMADVQAELIRSLSTVRAFVFVPFLPLFKLIYRHKWNRLAAIRKRQEALYFPLIDACRRRSHGRRSYDDEPPPPPTSYVRTLLDLRVPVDDDDDEAADDDHGSGGNRGKLQQRRRRRRRRLEDGELVGLCSEFLGSGTESVAAAMQWILANLMKRPEVQEAVRREIDAAVDADAGEVGEEVLEKLHHFNAVILEALRLHPTTMLVFRQVMEEDQVVHNGQRVPTGTKMVFPVRDLARDKTVWADPDEFKPERFHGCVSGGSTTKNLLSMPEDIKMMPFGAGRRMCPGINFSVLHIGYFTANLLREFEWVEAEGDDAVQLHSDAIIEMFNFMKHPLRARLVSRRLQGEKIR